MVLARAFSLSSALALADRSEREALPRDTAGRAGLLRISTSSLLHESKKSDADLEKELERLNEVLKKDFDATVKQNEEQIDKNFMNFKARSERDAYQRSASMFSWKVAAATLGIGGSCLLALFYIRKIRLEEREKHMKYVAGKARIGGDWELVNTQGKLEGSEQLKGSWLLLYFGFTHCPDICPDEIEKMVKVNKVAKTFRVYHSQGPRTGKNKDDYIVDHTVITYLIDPDGHFHDYYGQTRTAEEIANVIEMKEYGEGSEYGKAAREEARRKKYGRQARSYKLDSQPWHLSFLEPDGRTRKMKSIREGGAGEHADYWVFLKQGEEFLAYKVDDWHKFLPAITHKTLDIDQAEEKFLERNKVMNQFALKAQILSQLKTGEEDGEQMEKPTRSLKIKDGYSSSDSDGEEDDRNDEEGAPKKKDATSKKKKAHEKPKKDKRQRVENGDEVAKYESSDGEDEGREYDYMSDSGSDSE
ncbi:unnamed protein product [Heligmosomoides polygyrus]|uniref:Transcription initiation factor IIF subunit alpha n=1 Tax=Heligmosomoides polygyrus TaxID=6339 RepID=A0A183FWX4_HELPZ|nr:unnamed protein product [Heligmosomoides polygyrus]